MDSSEYDNVGMNYDHVIYLRVFEGCNLYCSHCFIPSNPKKMKLSQIDEAVNKIKDIAIEGDSVLIQWHGGEPTALGVDWFEEALAKFSDIKGINIKHGIQTNLINFSIDWLGIYEKYFDSEIGVSWDPGIRHIKEGKNLSNELYEKVFWEKLALAQKSGLSVYLIVTGTKVFFKQFLNPRKFIEMLEEKGIRKVHIERLTKTGYARENWDYLGVSNLEYSKYMKSFYRAYLVYDYEDAMSQNKLRISPFDGLEQSVLNLINGRSGGYGCLSGACDSRFHTIDASGYKHGCTAINSESDNKNAKAVSSLTFFDISKMREKRTFDCENCEFKPICSSGCLASSKDDGSGECSGSKRLFREISENVMKRI